MVSLTASARVRIERPIEEVWAFASHVPNMEQWVDGMSETELIGGGEVGRGSEICGVYTYGGGSAPVLIRVTAFQPPRRMVTDAQEGPFPFVGELELVRLGGGTEVTNTLSAGSDHIVTTVMFRLLPFIVRPMMAKQLRKELGQLKAILEGGA